GPITRQAPTVRMITSLSLLWDVDLSPARPSPPGRLGRRLAVARPRVATGRLQSRRDLTTHVPCRRRRAAIAWIASGAPAGHNRPLHPPTDDLSPRSWCPTVTPRRPPRALWCGRRAGFASSSGARTTPVIL